ncbi:hypothetical protein ATN84_12940 [Paramesorhizobium deserti]|uniref:Uncharacterized protein n=1 Tax=Paramesorhizobium deserti TaxID=1494590 RepID=A0A135HUN3_9HYPH|nr:hypothetical protein ATN84_12940 [Paramesorhizobium deserti]
MVSPVSALVSCAFAPLVSINARMLLAAIVFFISAPNGSAAKCFAPKVHDKPQADLDGQIAGEQAPPLGHPGMRQHFFRVTATDDRA